MDIIAIIGAVTTLLGSLGGFGAWVKSRLDKDAGRLKELEDQRDHRFAALEARLSEREQNYLDMMLALSRAEFLLESTRADLDRAVKALNRERGRPCRFCGRKADQVQTLDEITEEMP